MEISSTPTALPAEMKPIKGAARTHTNLANVLFECRQEPFFTADMENYYRERLSAEEIKEPAVIMGGRVLVGGRFIRHKHF